MDIPEFEQKDKWDEVNAPIVFVKYRTESNSTGDPAVHRIETDVSVGPDDRGWAMLTDPDGKDMWLDLASGQVFRRSEPGHMRSVGVILDFDVVREPSPDIVPA